VPGMRRGFFPDATDVRTIGSEQNFSGDSLQDGVDLQILMR